MNRTYLGFGFGAIQSGLFLYEAHKSANFSRLVVAEVMQDTVDSVNKAGGSFNMNIACDDGVHHEKIDDIEIYNPLDEEGREKLIQAVAEASEIGTAVPSVDFFGGKNKSDIASIIAEGIKIKAVEKLEPCIIYTAENNNHAAEILEQKLDELLDFQWNDYAACLNTVVGKMSGITADSERICRDKLLKINEFSEKAFLVESFNKILITKVPFYKFKRSIEVFREKDDLLPFEEAKLYGHNAVHAMLGYLVDRHGAKYMSEASEYPEILQFAEHAFIEEAGKALCRKYNGLDNLFTSTGFSEYAEDLLHRIINPFLGDTVERVVRDPERKLAWNDRLIGTVRLCLSQNVNPANFAETAAIAVKSLAEQNNSSPEKTLSNLWREEDSKQRKKIVNLISSYL